MKTVKAFISSKGEEVEESQPRHDLAPPTTSGKRKRGQAADAKVTEQPLTKKSKATASDPDSGGPETAKQSVKQSAKAPIGSPSKKAASSPR